LDMMKAAGIGGIEVQPVYPLSLDNPTMGIRNLRYLSPEFLEALKFAATKAQRLGLTVDVTLGSGWPFGGPHIPIDLAPGCIQYKAQQVHCDKGSCEPKKVEVPSMKEDEKLIGVLAARRVGDGLDPAGVIDLTDKVGKDGAVELTFDDGNWEVMFFIEGHTLQFVKRAALGAEGYVLDHYSRSALQEHLETVGEPLVHAGSDILRAMFCDSLEVYGGNWSPNFLTEFQRRRGYDLRPYLPALWNRFGEVTPQVRIDYGRTLSELVIEGFIKPLLDWCHSRKVSLRMQLYGIPPVDLAGYAYVDLPEGEGRNWLQLSRTRWASSAAHLYGKPVCSAEAFTSLSRVDAPFPRCRFTIGLQDLKAAADIYFLQWVNHLIAHGYGYSPPSVGIPGWTLYAPCLINHNNTWWNYFSLLTAYIQRVGYVLRRGTPVVDIALYLPINDAWAKSTDPSSLKLPHSIHIDPELIKQILSNGYSFDLMNDDALINHAVVSEGRLLVNGIPYSIVVLPEVSFIPVRSIEKLRDFCLAGGVVIATRCLPHSACGLMGEEENSRIVKRVVQEIFGEGVNENQCGKGMAYLVKDYGKGLIETLRAHLSPDVDFSHSEPEIGFIHRQMGKIDLYFVANTSPQPKRLHATFRVGHKAPQLLEPLTGEAHPVHVYSFTEEGTKVPLTLEPFGSAILAFAETEKNPLILDTNLPEVLSLEERKEDLVLKGRVDQNGRYFVQGRRGRVEAAVEDVPPPIVIRGPWNVSFKANGGEVVMTKLRSWTEYPQYRYFSGRANYTTEVTLPEGYKAEDMVLQLDLGDVREIAEVYVNDVKVGVTWMVPHVLDATPFLRPGRNTLRVLVTNLLINKVLGMAEPDYKELNARYGERFPQPIENKTILNPFPSGLLGPVRLIPSKIIHMTLPSPKG